MIQSFPIVQVQSDMNLRRGQAGQNDLMQAAATGGSRFNGKEATGTVGDEGTSSVSYHPPGGDQVPYELFGSCSQLLDEIEIPRTVGFREV